MDNKSEVVLITGKPVINDSWWILACDCNKPQTKQKYNRFSWSDAHACDHMCTCMHEKTLHVLIEACK